MVKPKPIVFVTTQCEIHLFKDGSFRILPTGKDFWDLMQLRDKVGNKCVIDGLNEWKLEQINKFLMALSSNGRIKLSQS
jgi:hypothetical protein